MNTRKYGYEFDENDVAIIIVDSDIAHDKFIDLFKMNDTAFIDKCIPGDDTIPGFWMLSICGDRANHLALDMLLLKDEFEGTTIS